MKNIFLIKSGSNGGTLNSLSSILEMIPKTNTLFNSNENYNKPFK